MTTNSDSDTTTDGIESPVDSGNSLDDQVQEHVDGVTVHKEIGRRDDHSRIAFVVDSERDDPVLIVLRDRLPSGVSFDDVGFHADYHGECWRFDDERQVVFEREVDPGDTLATLYGVQITDVDRLEAFLRSPVVLVDPQNDDADGDEAPVAGGVELPPELIDEGSSSEKGGDADDDGVADEPIEDVSLGEDVPDDAGEAAQDDVKGESGVESDAVGEEGKGDAVGEADESDATENGDESDAKDESDAASDSTEQTSGAGAVSAGEDDGLDGEAHVEQTLPGDSVVEALFSELRELPEDRRRDLAALLAPDLRRSQEARLDSVQRRVDDLVAYRDALEAFLDEEGGAPEIVQSLESDLDELRAELEDLSEGVEDELTDVEDSFEASIDQVTETIEMELAEIERKLGIVADEFHEDLDDVERNFQNALDENIGSLQEALDEDVGELRSRLDEDVGELHGRLDEIESVEPAVDELEDSVEDLRDDLAALDRHGSAEFDRLDERIDAIEDALDERSEAIRSLEAEVESLRSTVEEGAEWRATVSQSFPAVGDPGQDGEAPSPPGTDVEV